MGMDLPVFVKPPGFEVTVYPVIGLSPSDAGGEKVTVACPFPAVAFTFVGAPGVPTEITREKIVPKPVIPPSLVMP